MPSLYTKLPPRQPTWELPNMTVSQSMLYWMMNLPDPAYSMAGSLMPYTRGILFSLAPDDTSEEDKLTNWPSVSYEPLMAQWGSFRGVIVAFHRPATGNVDNETVYVGIHSSHWRDGLSSYPGYAPMIWRQMIINWIRAPGHGMFFSHLNS
ncbi:hypothetical protein M407DRAFT_31756 [Tulasnella calospora MUT 4182]|uniref:Uncharacterized protein n=1 Tax=Tulasnella calospora MUT 4182 TaxID=1051891 RepID=A0A0C3PUP4_9AGAM|nr:hypothetical protein M407DRAFT_31756 [Tulasnella calospora MUT 4182]